MSSTMRTCASSSEMSRSLVTFTSPDDVFPLPYVEIPMKYTNTSRFMARARSVRKKNRALKNADQWQISAGIVPRNLLAELANPGLNLLGGNQAPQLFICHE